MGTQEETPKPTPTQHKIIAIFLGLLSLTAAHPDPATLFETIVMPNEMEGRSAPENIKDVLMDQGILLAEETFDSSLTKSTCLARELCQFGAKEEARFSFKNGQITIGTAIDTITLLLSKMKESSTRDTKNIDNLLGAVEVGKSLGGSACKALYECEAATPKARVTCESSANICPALAMSCTFCGIFLPAGCGISCTAAGVYCGVAGYSC